MLSKHIAIGRDGQVCFSTSVFLGCAKHREASTDGVGPPVGDLNRMTWIQKISQMLALWFITGAVTCLAYGWSWGCLWVSLLTGYLLPPPQTLPTHISTTPDITAMPVKASQIHTANSRVWISYKITTIVNFGMTIVVILHTLEFAHFGICSACNQDKLSLWWLGLSTWNYMQSFISSASPIECNSNWYFLLKQQVLLKTLLPVCRIYSTRWVSSGKYSMRQGQVLYLSRDSHQVLYILYIGQMKQQCFKWFIVFLHLLIEQTIHKNVSVNTFMEQTNGFLWWKCVNVLYHSVTTTLTHYGSVETFDPPTQNTINVHQWSVFPNSVTN